MDRRSLGGIDVLVSTELEERGFLGAFTERAGGVSAEPFGSLNLGGGTGDDPEAVVRNRRRTAQALGIGSFSLLRQVHGTTLVPVADPAASGFADPEGPSPEGDAAVARGRGLPVAILTADCVPIALASGSEGSTVAVHAGWRGLAAGLIDRAIEVFERPAGVVAAIGPAIGPCHYEVGEEVARAVHDGTGGLVPPERRDGRLYLDLPGTVEARLRAAGVPTVDRALECTACESARFFSHRRDGVTGRQALILSTSP